MYEEEKPEEQIDQEQSDVESFLVSKWSIGGQRFRICCWRQLTNDVKKWRCSIIDPFWAWKTQRAGGFGCSTNYEVRRDEILIEYFQLYQWFSIILWNIFIDIHEIFLLRYWGERRTRPSSTWGRLGRGATSTISWRRRTKRSARRERRSRLVCPVNKILSLSSSLTEAINDFMFSLNKKCRH